MERSAVLGLVALALGCGAPDEPSSPPPPLGACAAASGCTLYLEAEAFEGPWSRQQNLRPFHGWGFAVSQGDDAPLVARITVPAGRYHLHGHAYADGQDRSWQVEVAPAVGAPQALPPAFGPAGEEGSGFRWAALGSVALPGGEVELRIRDAGGGFETPDLVVLTSSAGYDPAAVERGWRGHAPGAARRAALDDLAARAERAAARVTPPLGPLEWLPRRDRLRAQVADALGVDLAAPRTPLLAEVHGTVAADGYRIERLSFESRPGMVVSAHVLVPDGAGPFPAVVVPIGHYWAYGKADHRTSAVAHGLAQQGVLTLVYDAFGQGERDIPGNGHPEHWGLVLTGRSNMTFMIWDTIRALDYLETRPDVDPSRLALTGGSGGGINTLYTAALDTRVRVAAPAIYPIDLSAQIGSELLHDPCALLPGLLAFTNTDEVAALIAPRRQRWLAGRSDRFFPIEGTEAAAARAAARYAALGEGEAFDLVTASGGHRYALSLRQALYAVVRGAFEDPAPEPPVPEPALDLPPRDDPSLLVFERGFVPEDTTTVREIAKGWTQAAVDALPGPGADRDALQGELRHLLGAPGATATATLTRLGPLPGRADVTAVRVDRDGEVPLWGRLSAADAPPDAPVVVVVDASGLASPAALDAVAARGAIALHVSLRGRGDGRDDEVLLAGNHLMLGAPLLGLRALDLAAVADAVRRAPGLAGRPVELVAIGAPAGLVALAAQALALPFDRAVVTTPPSLAWTHRVKLPRVAFVQGVLRTLDLPHLAALAARRPLGWGTDAEGLAEVHPDWAAALAPQVGEVSSLRAALDRLAALRD